MENYQYLEVKRNSLFKNRYLYKAHIKASVLWRENKEVWNNEEDKEYMEDIHHFLTFRFPEEDFVIQGAVIYCNNLEVIFTIRLRYDEKLIKIEKAELK